MMSAEVAGLRKRLSSFKPLTSSPVSDLCAAHGPEDGHSGKDCGCDGIDPDEAYHEDLTHSVSSISSHSSRSAEEDDEGEPNDSGMDESGSRVKGDTSTPPSAESPSETSFNLASAEGGHKDLPRVSTNFSQPSLRTQRRDIVDSHDVKRARNGVVSPASSWLGYDLSIIVALVSPIGNLLTGSDHIKNVLLLLLLIYYLHQLVEVPWTLYRMSIPPEEALSPVSRDMDPTKLAARAELHSLELFYLTLTVLSPFLGATLLRYIATSIYGDPATLSWFSISLFVLATGIRPWTHLTERLKDRSHALRALLDDFDGDKDFPQDQEATKTELDSELSGLHEKFDALDKRMTDLDVSGSRELDDLADAIDSLETSLRRHRSETDKKTQDCEARLSVLETYVLDLHRRDRHTHVHADDSYLRGARLRSVFWDVLALPWTILVVTVVLTRRAVKRVLSTQTPVERTRHLTHSHSKYPTPTLETIVEEDNDSHGMPPKEYVASDSSQTLVEEVIRYRRDFIEFSVTIALRFLAFLFSPVLFTIRMLLFAINIPRALLRISV